MDSYSFYPGNYYILANGTATFSVPVLCFRMLGRTSSKQKRHENTSDSQQAP